MTTVEILFSYAAPPTEAVTLALANTLEVYGFRRLEFDRAARTLRVEYDATRLNAATVANLIRKAGLQIVAPSTMLSPAQLTPESAPAA
jgi:hypothetical protein